MLPTALLVLVGSAVGLQQSAVLPVARVRSSSRTSLPSAAAAELAKSTRLLELIENTDRGIGASSELRAEIGAVISGLESSWEGTDAFAEPARSQLLRRCEVAYVGQASSKAANAAGGKYRGRLGRGTCISPPRLPFLPYVAHPCSPYLRISSFLQCSSVQRPSSSMCSQETWPST